MGKLKEYKIDILIYFVAIIFIVLIFAWGMGIKGNKKNISPVSSLVKVSVDGNIIETRPLNKDEIIKIDNEYGLNVIEIKDGTVRMTESDCSNNDCVHMNAIHFDGESIICLPHRLVVSIDSDEEGEIDAFAY